MQKMSYWTPFRTVGKCKSVKGSSWYVTQRKLMKLFEGDTQTDIFNSTYCLISNKHFETKIVFISYSYEKL